jgi:acetolactate synthase-1/3 small subunit
MPEEENTSTITSPTRLTVLELRVRNHPGAMSHITGLFARRAFNLEAILCAPDPRSGPGEATSTMLLGVADEPRLEQVERQLAKLHDVLAVRHRPDLPADIFATMLPRVR